MSETENPPLDPADPPSTQGGGSNLTQPGGNNPEPDPPADARSADPPTTQGGGG